MPLPRNLRHRNATTHIKTEKVREVNKKSTELINVCDKHSVREFSFKNCKMAKEDGKTTFIEHKQIRGHLRAGLMLVKAETMTESPDAVYDLVQIANGRKDRMEKRDRKNLKKPVQNWNAYRNWLLLKMHNSKIFLELTMNTKNY